MAFAAPRRERCTLLNVRPANESTMNMRVSSRGRGGDGGSNGDQINSIIHGVHQPRGLTPSVSRRLIPDSYETPTRKAPSGSSEQTDSKDEGNAAGRSTAFADRL